MCLSCNMTHNTIMGKKQISDLFDFSSVIKELNKELKTDKFTEEGLKSITKYNNNILHTHDNKQIILNFIQIQEIVNNAIAVIATGVDMQIDVWCIQWPRDYKTINF